MTLALALLASTALAAPSSFELKPPPEPVRIGAPVELEGVARFPEGEELSLEPPEQSTGPVTVLGFSLDKAQVQDGMKTQRVRLRVAVFELGVVMVPPLRWTLRGRDAADAVLSPPVKLEATAPPPSPNDTADIRDIKPPPSPPWWALVLPLLFVLAAAGAGTYQYRERRRRRAAEEGGAAPDLRPPHQRALDELQALRGRDLPVKEYYDRVSDILRGYFEQRFRIPALFLTTSDLLRHMRQAEIDRSVLARSRELFERCDLAKFAKFAPAPQERDRDLDSAVSIVHDTEPKPTAPVGSDT